MAIQDSEEHQALILRGLASVIDKMQFPTIDTVNRILNKTGLKIVPTTTNYPNKPHVRKIQDI